MTSETIVHLAEARLCFEKADSARTDGEALGMVMNCLEHLLVYLEVFDMKQKYDSTPYNELAKETLDKGMKIPREIMRGKPE